jgi:spore coat polysaccharide biosynthesis protein SpsF
LLDEVVVATTTKPGDDVLVDLCKSEGWSWFRGSEEDVLDRYYRAAKQFSADVVVRITSDCPLIEPEVTNLVIKEFIETKPDYTHTRNYPRGLDTEVFGFGVLERIWHEDKNPAWREHVTPYIYRHPEKFSIKDVCYDEDLSFMRWTVDTQEDLEFARRIYDHFGHDLFSWREVLNLLKEHPEWLEINKHIVQKTLP